MGRLRLREAVGTLILTEVFSHVVFASMIIRGHSHIPYVLSMVNGRWKVNVGGRADAWHDVTRQCGCGAVPQRGAYLQTPMSVIDELGPRSTSIPQAPPPRQPSASSPPPDLILACIYIYIYIMKSSILLAACASGLAVQALSVPLVAQQVVDRLQSPFSEPDRYLIELAPGETRWVTEAEKWELRRVSLHLDAD